MAQQRHRVLFVCAHNSFRSQIAEAILNTKHGDIFFAESAGLSKQEINPLAIEVMNDYGLDISKNPVKNVHDLYREGRLYEYVITVCSKETEKECPLFPGIRKRINWALEDPDTFLGNHDEQLKKAIQLRNEIAANIHHFADPQE